MKYKIGQRVRIKTLEEFKKIPNIEIREDSIRTTPKTTYLIVKDMFSSFGKKTKIEEIDRDCYRLEGISFYWEDWMLVDPLQEMLKLI